VCAGWWCVRVGSRQDNVPFHTVIFPSMLIGAEEKWTLMRNISTTEYLNYEDAQFSKSRGVGVFGNHCEQTNIPPEVRKSLAICRVSLLHMGC